MNSLEQLILDTQPRLRPMGLEFITQHPTDAPDQPFRAYLTHRRGGLLAVTHGRWHGDAKRGLSASTDHLFWFPCWPERPNYPIKAKWFQHSHLAFDRWQEAVACALMPEHHTFPDELSRKIALDRSAKLRDSFRAAVLWAQLQNL